jgi:sterol desaturase/sphingolipid hydroxylase (fatty acid hydroxylase superfamily)
MLNDYFFYTHYFYEFLLNWSAISSEKLAVFSLIIFFGLLFLIETHFPHKKWPSNKWLQSYRTNFSLFLFNNILLSLLSVSTLLVLAEQHSGHGVLNYVSNPVGKLILSFLLLDLIIYFWHWVCHKYEGLWMVHKIHHSDPYMNVSTAFRLHIMELIIVTFLKATLIVILGMNGMAVLLTETITTIFVMFHHANISFAGERFLSRLFIVPFLHRTHHSTERDEHDSNYGAVLSIWDRIFGTLLEKEPLEIGIKNNASLGFLAQLKFGFINAPAPALAVSQLHDEFDINFMISEAAYYKAEYRDFSPGKDLDDWLEAETEIKDKILREMAEKSKIQPRKNKFWLPSPAGQSGLN